MPDECAFIVLGGGSAGAVPVRRPCAPGWPGRVWRGPYGQPHAECVPNR